MKTEFQAVILAGYGQRLNHLVYDGSKALLPVANKPMISYTLQWLENAGISDIIIVTTPEAGPKLSHYLTKIYERRTSSVRVEIVTPEAYGTVDALCSVKDKIKTDFIVLGCDLLTDIPLSKMIDTFRLYGPTFVALFSDHPKYEYVGIGSKIVEPQLFVGLDGSNKRLTLMETKEAPGDYEERYSHITIPLTVMNDFGTMNIYSNVADAHVYIFKRFVMDFLCSQKDMNSIREDLIPLLVKCQFSKKIRLRENLDKFITPERYDIESKFGLDGSQNIKSATDSFKKLKLAESSPSRKDSISCYALVNFQTPTNRHYCLRVNTIPAFVDMNRMMTKFVDERISPSAVIEKSTVGADSMVGYGTKIGERSAIKRSVIGAHCTIGKYAKISNCIILDYVVLEDNVKLENCILCSRCTIKDKSSLRDCEVGSKYVVEASTVAKGEHFLESRTLSAEDGDDF